MPNENEEYINRHTNKDTLELAKYRVGLEYSHWIVLFLYMLVARLVFCFFFSENFKI